MAERHSYTPDKKFWRRTLSVVMLVPIVLLIIYLGELLYLILVSFVVLMMQVEYCRLAQQFSGHFNTGLRATPYMNPVPPVLLTVGFCVLAYFAPALAKTVNGTSIAALVPYSFFIFALIYVFAESIFSGKIEGELVTVTLKFTGIMTIGWVLGYHLILLRNIHLAGIPGADSQVGRNLIFLLAGTVWCSDTGAYLIGRIVGKHRLGTPISPRKTVEGAIAGLIFGTLVGLGIGVSLLRDTLSLLNAAFIGLLLSALGQFGDLSESLMKRTAGVKDSGDVIPGHGGFLDRCDSLIFSTPVLYYYIELTQAFSH